MTSLDDLFDDNNTQEEQFSSGEVFLPMLRKQIEEDNVLYVKEPKIRASSIGACPRYIMYMMKGYENKKTAKDVLTLDVGTLMHEILQKYIKKIGVLKSLEEKVSIDDREDSEGSYDGLLEINGEEYLLEIKTMNVEAYQRQIVYRKIYPKYLAQSNYYMESLGLKKTLWIFVNKNGVFTQEFQKQYKDMDYDPVLFEQLTYRDQKLVDNNAQRIQDIKKHLKDNTMPKRVTVSQCKWCSLIETCKSDWKKEKKMV